MKSSRPPIPSFHYPGLDQCDDDSVSDEDDANSIQTQEGACEQQDCGKAKEHTTEMSQKESESSNKVVSPDSVDGAPAQLERAAKSSIKPEEKEERKPSARPTRAFRPAAGSASEPIVLSDSDESSIDLTPPASLPETATQAAVTPSPPRPRSTRSSSRISATSLRNRKRPACLCMRPSCLCALASVPEATTQAAVTSSQPIRETNIPLVAASTSNKKRLGSQAPVVSRKRNKAEAFLQLSPNFEAKTAETFNIPVHTLILGDFPSKTSQQYDKYYANMQCAFWWIVGDCLGFRRDKGVSQDGVPYKSLHGHLRYDDSEIIPYELQLQTLCCKGFGLWNTFKRCNREGSMNKTISGEVANDIRKWCEDRPSVRRIVFAVGKSSFQLFAKHFEDWLRSGELVPSQHKASQDAFRNYPVDRTAPPPCRTIECVVAVSVSPSFCSVKYPGKRDFWEEHVFQPGLQDFAEWEDSTRHIR